MSNDLISRKALLRALNKWDISKLHLVEDVKALVKEQPTAYDIDKVVEQLEEASYGFEGFEYIDLDEAIKIVKGGCDE